MKPETSAKLRLLGAELSPSMLQGTIALMASLAAPRDSTVEVTRDRQYGPDERNRLDVFCKGSPVLAPVLVYVHGGGFVMGDKTSAGSPFYDNVGQWAAQQGWIGVTLTYRLAPMHRWPCGPEDMGRAVGWMREHIAAFGGDPQKIILMGQSAGAAHVAAYVSQAGFRAAGSSGIAGAVLISGIFDVASQPPNQHNTAYYGDDPAVRAAASSIGGLLATDLPLLFTVSEFDPRDFQDQAAQLTQAWHRHKGCHPPLEFLAGHNHLSPGQSLGSAEGELGSRLTRFVAEVSQS